MDVDSHQSAAAQPLTKAEIEARKKSKKLRKAERKALNRGFVWSRQAQRFVALRIAYLGGAFDGFAQQLSSPNTVEEHLHAAFHSAMLVSDGRRDAPGIPQPRNYAYTRCGRTDKGVSAFGQVVSLRLRSKLRGGHGIILPPPVPEGQDPDTPETYAEPTAEAIAAAEACEEPADDANEIDYCAALNAKLPPEIRVTGWAPVSSTFNARYDCTYRLYKYFLLASGIGTTPSPALDIEAMREACKAFVGKHDFRNYCKADLVNVDSFVREIYEATVEPVDVLPAGSLYCFTVKGSGFLWHQVRCMASILQIIGRHEEPISIASTLLDIEKCPGKPSYPPASDLPLVLYDCGFKQDLHFISPAKPLNNLWSNFQRIWADAVHTYTMTTLFLTTLDALPVIHTVPRPNGAPPSTEEKTVVIPLSESREMMYRENLARKERSASGKQGVRPGGLKRSLEDLSAEAKTLTERRALMSGNKRAKYEAKQQRRISHTASGAAAEAEETTEERKEEDVDDDDDGTTD